MFPEAAAGRAQHRRAAGQRPRRALRPLAEPRPRPARDASASCRSRCLAEEIETPGDGPGPRADHDRGQPGAVARRTARGSTRALGTARVHGQRRHLPQRDDAPRRRDPAARPRRSQRAHYDLALYQLAVRNVANYSPPVLDAATGGRSGRVARCCCGSPAIVAGQGADADVDALDEQSRRGGRARASAEPARRSRAATPAELLAALEPRARPRAPARPHAAHRAVRRRLRRRPGRAHARHARGRTRTASISGRSQPRIPEVLRTPSGQDRARAEPLRRRRRAPARRRSTAPRRETLVLIGRRHLRSNNSWMHNLPMLVRGRAALHAPRPSRRRRAPRPRRRRRRRGRARGPAPCPPRSR